MVGCARQRVNQLISRMTAQGLLFMRKGRVVIRDEAGLAGMVTA